MISIYSTLTSGLNPADSLHSGRFVLLGSSILIDAHLKYLGRVLQFQRQSRAAVECHSGSIRNVQIPFLLFHTTFYIGRHRVPIRYKCVFKKTKTTNPNNIMTYWFRHFGSNRSVSDTGTSRGGSMVVFSTLHNIFHVHVPVMFLVFLLDIRG